MILSLSRRTDIPAYYSTWLLNRLDAGYALARNPFNHNQIRRISLAPEDVTAMVFWTKNPRPLFAHLKRFREYAHYFQFTLTPYNQLLEPSGQPKEAMVEAFKYLAGQLGPHRVIWRYDPIIITPALDQDYHRRNFARLASALRGRVEQCVVSFLTPYPKLKKFLSETQTRRPDQALKQQLLLDFLEIAEFYGIRLKICADGLKTAGLAPAACVDAELLEKLVGFKPLASKDKYQRPLCRCLASVDLGAYNSCPAGCRYCYANRGVRAAVVNYQNHNPHQPFLSSFGRGGPAESGRPGTGRPLELFASSKKERPTQ